MGNSKNAIAETMLLLQLLRKAIHANGANVERNRVEPGVFLVRRSQRKNDFCYRLRRDHRAPAQTGNLRRFARQNLDKIFFLETGVRQMSARKQKKTHV